MYSLLYHIWEEEGGGAAGAASRKVLKFDRPLAGGFLGLTGLRPEGCGGRFAAVYMPPLAAALPVAAKTKQPRFARENAPLLPTAPPPEGGGLLSVSPCANLSSS